MRPKLYAALGGLALLGAALLWFGFQRGPLAPVAVETAVVEETPLSDSVFGIGTVEPRYAYAIGPTQAGRVLRVHVDHGDAVTAGQLLAEIDPVDLEQRLASAASMLARTHSAILVARAQQREARSRQTIAEANAARYADLVAKNFVSREAAEIRANEAGVARAASEAADATLQAAQRDAERAVQDRRALERQLANLRLTSPVNGLVIAREAEPGTTVVAGQAVVRVIDPRSVWVRARIDQSRAGTLQPGLRAEIVLRSAQGTAIPGRVARVEIQNDAVSEERIVAVDFEASAPMSIGELAEVTIHRERLSPALAIPSAAVKRRGGEQGVWQFVEGRTYFRAVRTGLQTLDGMTQLVDGLAAGDEVIVYSGARLREGMKVRPGSAR
ncbi:MAG TPA: efflux RND transporter periplasmic adaptor subunit [Burkholderiales bacterium]|nr:efflux RND transporter periplasmic adaptor subunit [Burkholderiales bacterium]